MHFIHSLGNTFSTSILFLYTVKSLDLKIIINDFLFLNFVFENTIFLKTLVENQFFFVLQSFGLTLL